MNVRSMVVPTAVAALVLVAGGCESNKTSRASSNDGVYRSDAAARPSGQSRQASQATPRNRVFGISEMSFPTGSSDSSLVRVTTQSRQEQARVGQPFAYEFNVTNLSNDLTLENVTIHQDMPGNMQIAGVRPEGLAEGGAPGEWQIGQLAPGETKTFEVAMVPQEPGRFDTCVRVSYDPVLCTTIDVVAPELRLTKEVPPQVLVCEPIPVRYVVTNTGSGNAENVIIREQLPEGITGPDGARVIEIDAGTLGAGQSKEFTMNLRAQRPGEFAGEAMALSEGGLEARADARPTLIGAPDLEIELTGPENEFTGKPVEYQIVLHNRGNAPAANTTLNLTVDPSAKLVSSSLPVKGGFANIDFGTIPPGQSKEAVFVFQMGRPGEVQFAADATAVCADRPSQQLVTTIRGVSSLLLEVVDNNDPVRIGTEEVYQIMVVNQGGMDDHNIQVVAEVPEQFEIVRVQGPTQPQGEGRQLVFGPVATLPAGERVVWNITVRARAGGDVRFKTQMTSDNVIEPVIETEATRLY